MNVIKARVRERFVAATARAWYRRVMKT